MGFISISNSERCELDFSLVTGIYGHYITTLIYHLNQAILTPADFGEFNFRCSQN